MAYAVRTDIINRTMYHVKDKASNKSVFSLVWTKARDPAAHLVFWNVKSLIQDWIVERPR